METTDLILGLDVGGTNFRMGLVDTQLCVRNVEVVPSANISGSANTPYAVAELILSYCQRHLGEGKMPKMVSAGFPSLVDRGRRRLYSSTNFPGLDGVDIVEVLEKKLRVPVVIEHDAYYLLACDLWKQKIIGKGTMLGFYFGTGMGNAIFMDGKPYIGKNGAACEVGHMPTGLDKEPCSCGNHGCVEMHCCGKALEHLASKQYPNTPIVELFMRYAQEQPLREFVRYMAVPIATEINVLDPEAVFIGGGLVNMIGFPHEALLEAVLLNTRKPYPATDLKLYFSDGAKENGIIGAALEGMRRLS